VQNPSLRMRVCARSRAAGEQFMNPIIDTIEKEQQKSDAKTFSVGDSVRVHTRVVEGDKERIQIFAGVVIGRKGRGLNETFTVRRISYGEGVEGISPAFAAHRKSGSGKTRPRSPLEAKLSSYPQGEGSDSSQRVIDCGRLCQTPSDGVSQKRPAILITHHLSLGANLK